MELMELMMFFMMVMRIFNQKMNSIIMVPKYGKFVFQHFSESETFTETRRLEQAHLY